MGGEKNVGQAKGGKAKAKTPRQRLSDKEGGSGGDARRKSTKPNKERTEATAKSQRAEKVKVQKKVKALKTESVESFDDDVRFNLAVKEEPEDGDFVPEKRGKKRKRPEDEPMEGPSCSSATPTLNRKLKEKDEADPRTEKNTKEGIKIEKKPKKEEAEHPVTTKKKSKEEIEAAKALKIKKREEEEQQRWRWWEEDKYEDGIKWKFLEHRGPFFPPEYQHLPDNVNFYYNGKVVKLGLAAEEVALFFAQMLDHEYTTKDVFRNNFFKDWRKEMTLEERVLISDLNKCDFRELHTMHKEKVEARKVLSKEEKLVMKEANQKIVEEYGFCILDHHRERIGNFKIEPPGLFRGRGEHPKQGMLKKRIQPEDVIINCAK